MISNYDVEARRKEKMRSDDRVLVLRPMSGKSPRDVLGQVDPRLFSGENNMHVIYEDTSGMWKLRYDVGGLPESLKQKFTTFNSAVDAVKKYFETRNVEVTSIID